MPNILNLKFKGNKSFVAFSNLAESDSLTKTWKVCTKVASFLEQGQRLENLSWRLWHLQNLMVDTDNAKSKREFKKLSKSMGDKLDKEKGRSIEELTAPGFRRNHSTDIIQQRAVEKERNREASQNAQPGTIKRMQFTFSVDQPQHAPFGAPVAKPDLKPSAEFKDNSLKRPRPHPAPRATPLESETDTPLTQRGRKPSTSTQASDLSDFSSEAAMLRFPSLFSSDFGPSALLGATPSVRLSMSYGEGVPPLSASPDSFGVLRPTIELPLDDILSNLSADSPGPFHLPMHFDAQDVVMSGVGTDAFLPSAADKYDTDAFGASASMLGAAPGSMSPPAPPREAPPQTVAPSKLGHASASTPTNAERPKLTLKTTVGTRSSVPGATATSASSKQNSSAPGGVKAECSNCGATHTPLWRRGLNDELNCNACGLYCKLHKRPRPKTMRNSHGEGRTHATPRNDTVDVMAQCYNCHTTTTPLWRKDDEGKTVCNACGLYYKLHGSARPISMKSDVIRKRSRHDARRMSTSIGETPSASPGASRRASPAAEPAPTPTFAPDSSTTTQTSFSEYNYQQSGQSELMGALGNDNGQNSFGSADAFAQLNFASFPGPYHPDYIMKNVIPTDALPFASNEAEDSGNDGESRTSKRRRMSNVSTASSSTEPPLSAVSYSSYDSGFSSGGASAASFPYAQYGSFNLLRGAGGFWHPPMLPATGSPQFIHPPMLPPGEDAMDYLNQPLGGTQDDVVESLFSTYLHPPMMLPESPGQALSALQPAQGGNQVHPPMLPPDWKSDFFGDAMQTGY